MQDGLTLARVAEEIEQAEANAEAGKPRPSNSNPGRKPEGDRRFSNEELLEEANGLLGADRAAVYGALTRTNRQSHTLAQAEKLVNEHLRTPAETSIPDEPEDEG